MRVRVIAVGTRMPDWVDRVFADYCRRIKGALPIVLSEVASAPRRAGQSIARALALEGERLLAQLKPRDFVIALDEHGRELSTLELSRWLAGRLGDGRDLAFVIGGPDGLSPEVVLRSDFKLSLSRLTLPHALVRVLLAEQLYRAHTVLSGHPYHRD
jgi:23S rRNA (pseudouridine1915-N3)-methyltransferase